ncbi:MAG: penicillin acylase family protein [Dehalococcoidia bacterium]
MPMGRTLRTAALGALVVAGAASAGVYYLLRRPVPRSKGSARLAGLRNEAEIIRDRWGVPHVYASNLHDLFFAVGFAQAQDRLWQMEFHRRAASGTLSEVLGEPALDIDRLIRRVGFRRVSEAEWSDAEPTERAVLEAFSAGVNAYIERSRMPVEFGLLRYRPQPWHPVDTLTFARLISWSLSGNWDKEIVRSWTLERFGREVTEELETNYPTGAPLVVPPGAEARGPGPSLDEDFAAAAELLGALAGTGASNNWAVNGEKSTTGKPLLANDPHLPLSLPSLFWEVHIDSPELKCAGACLPGTPSIVIGHNDRIAWGVTASMVDGDDLFVEKLNPDNPSQYEDRGSWRDGEVVREEITVKGRKEPVIEEVLVTRHGPVISPAIKGEERTLAMSSVVLERGHAVQGLTMLMGARNWDEFRDALRLWNAPGQNFAYADVDGNIGYQLAGLTPLRAKGHGLVPVPGWSGEYDWTGWIPFDELPSTLNPDTNWVASANNKIVDDDYPYFLTTDWADSHRKNRIIEMLGEKEKLSVQDLQRMQGDQLSLPARELVPGMLALRAPDEWSQRALTFLRAWDHVVAADSVGACVFEVVYAHLVRKALQEKLGSWSDFYTGRGIHALRANGGFYAQAASWLVAKMRDRKDWFAGKTWEQAMQEALESAVAELRGLLGDDVSHWQWGRLHKQAFRHAMGDVRALSRLVNRGPVPVGGDSNTVWQASYLPYHGYELRAWTACYRQIIDLGDFDNSVSVIPGGESGHQGSRHYGDMIGMWSRVEYHPMLWERESVEEHARGRLVLEPAGGNGDGAGARA